MFLTHPLEGLLQLFNIQTHTPHSTILYNKRWNQEARVGSDGGESGCRNYEESSFDKVPVVMLSII